MRSLSLVVCLSFAAAARAQEAPSPAPSPAPVRPHKGSTEIRLSPPLIAGIGQGIGYYNLSCDNCTTSDGIFTFSVLGGAGYLLTDRVEVGGLLDLLVGELSEGSSTLTGFGLGIGPFVRFWTWLAPRAAMVPEISVLFRALNGSDNNGGGTTYTGVQALAQLQFEFFVAPMWSVRIGPGYQFIRLSPDRGSSSLTVHSLVVSWAIAVYF